CTMRQRVTIHEVEESRLTGRAITTVGDERVEVVIVQRRTTITQTAGAATRSGETVSSELFAPAWGLVVYQTSRTVTVGADGEEHTIDSTATLREGHP